MILRSSASKRRQCIQKSRRGSISSVEHHLSVSVHQAAAAAPPFADVPPFAAAPPFVVARQSLFVFASDDRPLLASAPLHLERVHIDPDSGAVVAGIAWTCQDDEWLVHSFAEPEWVPRSFDTVRQSCCLETDAEDVEWRTGSAETQYGPGSVQIRDADG
jgi:hypothetical protein